MTDLAPGFDTSRISVFTVNHPRGPGRDVSYEVLRERGAGQGGIHWEPNRHDPSGESGVWVVTGLDAYRAGLDPANGLSPELLVDVAMLDSAIAPMVDLMQSIMLFSHGDVHSRRRKLVGGTFRMSEVRAMQLTVEELAAELLGPLARLGKFDLTEYSTALPILVIMRLLGLPDADRVDVKDWSTPMAKAATNFPPQFADMEAGATATVAFRNYMTGIVARWRSGELPTTPISQDFLNARDEGAFETDKEMIDNIGLLLMAGHETTTNLIGNSIIELLKPENAEQLALLVEGKVDIRVAAEELLRLVGPVHMFFRHATQDVAIGDVDVKAGQTIVFVGAAANRDPAIADPQKLRFDRPGRNVHTAFGWGEHSCLGSHLARMEVCVALATLLENLKDLRMAPEAAFNPDNGGLILKAPGPGVIVEFTPVERLAATIPPVGPPSFAAGISTGTDTSRVMV